MSKMFRNRKKINHYNLQFIYNLIIKNDWTFRLI